MRVDLRKMLGFEDIPDNGIVVGAGLELSLTLCFGLARGSGLLFYILLAKCRPLYAETLWLY